MDWRVDAGKRRTRERTVHGNEKDLGARARAGGGMGLLFARIYGFTMRRVTTWLASYGMDLLPYYRITTRSRFRRRDKAS